VYGSSRYTFDLYLEKQALVLYNMGIVCGFIEMRRCQYEHSNAILWSDDHVAAALLLFAAEISLDE
jgi:hypothetical protein